MNDLDRERLIDALALRLGCEPNDEIYYKVRALLDEMKQAGEAIADFDPSLADVHLGDAVRSITQAYDNDV